MVTSHACEFISPTKYLSTALFTVIAAATLSSAAASLKYSPSKSALSAAPLDTTKQFSTRPKKLAALYAIPAICSAPSAATVRFTTQFLSVPPSSIAAASAPQDALPLVSRSLYLYSISKNTFSATPYSLPKNPLFAHLVSCVYNPVNAISRTMPRISVNAPWSQPLGCAIAFLTACPMPSSTPVNTPNNGGHCADLSSHSAPPAKSISVVR